MANTVEDVSIPNGVWVNLYSVTGITVGTAVDIWNKGSNPCSVAISENAPTTATIGIPLYVGAEGSYATVDAGETGLWAYCVDGDTILSVQVG